MNGGSREATKMVAKPTLSRVETTPKRVKASTPLRIQTSLKNAEMSGGILDSPKTLRWQR